MTPSRRNPAAPPLGELSGPRVRTLDEHSYKIDDGGVRSTFRLQLFVSRHGLPPVVVATQGTADQGMSLTNGCELIVGQVWRDHFADKVLPPVWVQRIIVPTSPDRDSSMLSSWQRITFHAHPQYHLSDPKWTFMSQDDVEALVGGPVDDQRGHVAHVPEPELTSADSDYALVPMRRMPLETPFRETCMSPDDGAVGTSRWELLLARAQRAAGLSCCWYHGGDWSAVIDTAARLISTAKVTGLGTDEKLRYVVLDAARAEGVSGWNLEALYSLLVDPIMIGENDGNVWFVNGQHRTRAMRDAGVTEVLVADSPRVGKTIMPLHICEH